MYSIGPVTQAWAHLLHSRATLLTSVAGVLLSLVLLLTLEGAYRAALDYPVTWLEQLDADLILTRYDSPPFGDGSNKFSREVLRQAARCDGVASVERLDVESSRAVWKNPDTGRLQAIRVLAFRPGAPLFLGPDVRRQSEALQTRGAVLFDRRSSEELGTGTVGARAELSGHPVEVVGQVEVGVPFRVTGNVLLGETTQTAVFGEEALQNVTLGLVRLSPGTDARMVLDRLRDLLPAEVAVLDKKILLDRERSYWQRQVPLALLLWGATLLTGVVGGLFGWWSLFRLQWPHQREFCLLHLLGCRAIYMYQILVAEALILFLLTGLPALLISAGCSPLLANWTGLPQRFRFAQALPWFGWSALLLVLLALMHGVCLRKRIDASIFFR